MKSTDAVYAEKIAEQYAKKSTPKVVALKKLDRKARKPAELFAYTFGVIGALVLGAGMCLAMGVIGSGSAAFAGGIVIGVLGIPKTVGEYPPHPLRSRDAPPPQPRATFCTRKK